MFGLDFIYRLIFPKIHILYQVGETLQTIGKAGESVASIIDIFYESPSREAERELRETQAEILPQQLEETRQERRQRFRQFLLDLGLSKDRLQFEVDRFDREFGLKQKGQALEESKFGLQKEQQKFLREDRAFKKSFRKRFGQSLGRNLINTRLRKRPA